MQRALWVPGLAYGSDVKASVDEALEEPRGPRASETRPISDDAAQKQERAR